MQDQTQIKLVSDVKTALRQLDYDVTIRNEYMNIRDRALYGDGLYHDLDIESWFAEYNYCRRVIDIHSSQLMGRGFNLYSYYNKTDVPGSNEIQDPQQLELAQGQAETENKLKKANADLRKNAIDAIIRDNGGMDIFKRGARQGSAYGNTAYKAWFDVDQKKYVINLIESVHNYRRGWDDTNFRSSDFDSYVYQISVDKANRLYGSKLPENASFDFSQEGEPFMDAFGDGDTGDPLNQNQTDLRPKETTRPMVTVIDFTGYISGYCGKGGAVYKCQPGDETKFNLLIAGGHIVQTITDEKRIPKYYFIPNRVEPRRAWGRSDLPQSALDINKEIILLMADQRTWADKNLFKLIMAKGFTSTSIPRKKARKSQVVAMSQEQSLEEMQTNPQSLQEWERLVSQRMDAFVRLTGVGHVLFDDPTNNGSNQALLTTLKGVIDIVEDKQSRWEPVLLEMFTDALKTSAEFIPEMKPYVLDDAGWYLTLEWPSVLRREDATYQTMWLNAFNAGVISVDTYHQKIGIPDSTEEIDRIKDNMKDWITAAIMGRGLSEVAHQAVMKEMGMTPEMMNMPKIILRGDLSPSEVGNIASTRAGADKGPYKDEIGPQGNVGIQANDATINTGFVDNPSPFTPKANYQAPNPQQTADNNTGAAPTSQPGSGATAVTGAGAVAQNNQQAGR